jgi:PLP dependent protein
VVLTPHALQRNLERIHASIARAAEKSGRRPEQITLLAATKSQPPESIRMAHQAGVRHFGENRVQEWEAKKPQLESLEATWHLIGHLQSNKAARAVELFEWFDTIDSGALARRLERVSAGKQKLPVLIEIKMDPTVSKTGLDQDQLPALTDEILSMTHLDLRGLMCVPPYFDQPEQTRPYFRRLRDARDALERRYRMSFPVLSMGMSHDFETAIEEGATMVRLGTALFGLRSQV